MARAASLTLDCAFSPASTSAHSKRAKTFWLRFRRPLLTSMSIGTLTPSFSPTPAQVSSWTRRSRSNRPNKCDLILEFCVCIRPEAILRYIAMNTQHHNSLELGAPHHAATSLRGNRSFHNGILTVHTEKATVKCASNSQKRGRKPASVPSRRLLEIIKATKTQTYAQISAKHKISRQRVGKIVRRWREYLPVRPLQSREAIKNGCGDQPPKKKETRIHVISFRLTAAEVQLLRARYPEMKSEDRAARGIVTKFLSI